MTTFLETPEDMQWLAEVHTPLAKDFKCAIITGNEDCPDQIDLYKENNVNCTPVILKYDPVLGYVRQ